MRACNLIVLFLLLADINLAAAETRTRVDASRLVKGIGNSDENPYAAAERHYLAGYMSGVADSLEGKKWCSNGKIKSGEIDSEVLAGIKKLPKKTLHENAAVLIEKILAQKFPCR
jgi:hypothetical protein